MQIKMGKYTTKNSSSGNCKRNDKRLARDSCIEDNNDSSLGPEFHLGLPESSVEESDCSSDSVDSGISCRRRLLKAKHPNSDHLNPMMHINSSLSMSLNHKMNQNSLSHNEPPIKRQRVTSNEDEKPKRATIHHYPSGATPQGVLTETVRRNAYQNSLLLDIPRDSPSYKGNNDYSSRNGDHIAALLSPNSHSLSRKRSVKKPSLHQPFPHVSKDGKIELRILVQPEEQHRARYMTEGSRGSIKDEKGTGYPTVKLIGYNQPITLQIFIGCDQGKVQPHLFYQACKVTGKNCTPCNEKLIDGTCVIEIQLDPANDMTVNCDCIGILKERNVDVEQRLPYFGLSRCKKRSTKCRMVFRINIPLANGTYETLQMTSSPILCTQSPGLPEICKRSLTECNVKGGTDLFIIGKNFQKDARIIFTEFSGGNSLNGNNIVWEESVEPEKEFMHQSHLVCCVPSYHNQQVEKEVKVMLTVASGGKSSEPHIFTYIPDKSASKNEYADLNYNTQPRIQTVEIKQEWNDDSESTSPIIGCSAHIMQPTILDSMAEPALPSPLLSPLQHMVSSANVGPLIINSNTPAVNQSTNYGLATRNSGATKTVEEVCHDVELMQGISRLASEIVKEQIDTSAKAHEMSCSQSLGSISQNVCFPVQNIKSEVDMTSFNTQMSLPITNEGIFLSHSTISQNCSSTLKLDLGEKIGSYNVMGSSNGKNSCDSALPKPEVTLVNSVPETIMSPVEFGPMPNSTMMLTAERMSATEELNMPPTTMAVPQQPVVIKTEKMSNLPQGTSNGQSNEMSTYQNSMTFALSQMSDADLLSMINPNTFECV